MSGFFLRKSNFIPDAYQKTLFDIDFAGLYAQGIKLLLIDLDNTLISYDVSEPDQKTIDLFAKLREKGLHIFIISNNHEPRVRHFSAFVDCPYVFGAKKPFPFGFRRACKQAGIVDPKAVCVIGDQFMTDVWGGKRLGFYVVVVDALKRTSEKWYTKINRKLEKNVLRKIKKNNPELFQKLGLAEKR